jgi:hypothetical protein
MVGAGFYGNTVTLIKQIAFMILRSKTQKEFNFSVERRHDVLSVVLHGCDITL